MDEAIAATLLRGAHQLAERMRIGLSAHGYSHHEFGIAVDGQRAQVTCSSPELAKAEFGEAGVQPRAPLEAMRRHLATDIVCTLVADLRETLR